ncbi:hypothetical protein GCM10020000_06760 [Streptomyces olivoverticillatus]
MAGQPGRIGVQMFTGSADELRRREQEARVLADEIAKALNALEEYGCVAVGSGEVVFSGGSIRPRGGRWSVC